MFKTFNKKNIDFLYDFPKNEFSQLLIKKMHNMTLKMTEIPNKI